MQYVVDANSGRVKRWGSAGQDAENGERVIDVPEVDEPSSVYFVGDEPRLLPASPLPFLDWDPVTEEWFDPRTAAEVEAELQAWRASTSMTKLEFGQRAVMFGFLAPGEFAAGMRGEIPAPFLAAVAALPPEMRDMAGGVWAGAREIERLDPFIMAVADAAGIDADALDILFGRMPGFDPL